MLLFSHLVMSDSLWPCGLSGLPVPQHLPGFAQVHVHCTGDAIQPSHPLTPSSPFALNLYQHQDLFQWVSCSPEKIKILEFQLRHQSFQWVFSVGFPYDWLVWSCCPKDAQETSPAPQFEDINSLVLHFLYCLALTTICDHWRDHSFDCMDLCFCFLPRCLGLS